LPIKILVYSFYFFLVCAWACTRELDSTSNTNLNTTSPSALDSATSKSNKTDSTSIDSIVKRTIKKEISVIESQLLQATFIDIQTLDSSIKVDLKYNSTDNFMRQNMYHGLSKAYFPEEVAAKICKAQAGLKQEFPNYSLIIFDAARPLSIQQYIWDSVKLKPYEKYQYISPPQNISLHNYGAAVDLSIINLKTDSLLDMGTSFDFFGKQAQPRFEEQYLQSGELNKLQITNRQLLRKVMQQAGFYGINTEWWHFNSTNKWVAAKKYALIK
jgi:zinc D-Ala-D-Ala dipeptidase